MWGGALYAWAATSNPPPPSPLLQNLVSTDTNAVNLAWQFVNYSWASLIQIALAMALLYGQLGPPAFVALGVMLLFIPLQVRRVRSDQDRRGASGIGASGTGASGIMSSFS